MARYYWNCFKYRMEEKLVGSGESYERQYTPQQVVEKIKQLSYSITKQLFNTPRMEDVCKQLLQHLQNKEVDKQTYQQQLGQLAIIYNEFSYKDLADYLHKLLYSNQGQQFRVNMNNQEDLFTDMKKMKFNATEMLMYYTLTQNVLAKRLVVEEIEVGDKIIKENKYGLIYSESKALMEILLNGKDFGYTGFDRENYYDTAAMMNLYVKFPNGVSLEITDNKANKDYRYFSIDSDKKRFNIYYYDVQNAIVSNFIQHCPQYFKSIYQTMSANDKKQARSQIDKYLMEIRNKISPVKEREI